MVLRKKKKTDLMHTTSLGGYEAFEFRVLLSVLETNEVLI
jgi:hypothetical protein